MKVKEYRSRLFRSTGNINININVFQEIYSNVSQEVFRHFTTRGIFMCNVCMMLPASGMAARPLDIKLYNPSFPPSRSAKFRILDSPYY